MLGAVSSASPDPEITRLLDRVRAGETGAGDELLPLVYDSLHDLAVRAFRGAAPGATLQPTMIVHEAYLDLLGDAEPDFENRRHFFFAAGRAMHDFVLKQAREKCALKRGGDKRRVDLDQLSLAAESAPEELLALEEALVRLQQDDPDAHRLVELRFFAGLPMPEIAELVGTPLRSLERSWRFVRARLALELRSDDV